MSAPLASSVRIAVLLDGDADFFLPSLLSQGHIGGRLAAERLHSRIAALFPASRPLELLCIVFWNLSGLSSYLSFTDQLAPSSLQAFAQGFSSTDLGAFSTVDTGGGKQAADRALKRHLAHFLPLFDHLYLGGTHDSGYATTLSSPLGAELSRKISLLQTTPAFAPNLAKLELTIVDARKWNLYDGRDPNNGKRHDMPRKDRAEPDQEEEAAKVNELYPDLPLLFHPLTSHLLHLSSLGHSIPPLSDILGYLGAHHPPPTPLFSTVPPGPTSWNEYVELARSAGVVEVGGKRGQRWIKLKQRER